MRGSDTVLTGFAVLQELLVGGAGLVVDLADRFCARVLFHVVPALACHYCRGIWVIIGFRLCLYYV